MQQPPPHQEKVLASVLILSSQLGEQGKAVPIGAVYQLARKRHLAGELSDVDLRLAKRALLDEKHLELSGMTCVNLSTEAIAGISSWTEERPSAEVLDHEHVALRYLRYGARTANGAATIASSSLSHPPLIAHATARRSPMITTQMSGRDGDGDDSSDLSTLEESEDELSTAAATKRVRKGQGRRSLKRVKFGPSSSDAQTSGSSSASREGDRNTPEQTQISCDRHARPSIGDDMHLEDGLPKSQSKRSDTCCEDPEVEEDDAHGGQLRKTELVVGSTCILDPATLPSLPVGQHYFGLPRSSHPTLTVDVVSGRSLVTSQPQTSTSVSTPYSGGGEALALPAEAGDVGSEIVRLREEVEMARSKELAELQQQKTIEDKLELVSRSTQDPLEEPDEVWLYSAFRFPPGISGPLRASTESKLRGVTDQFETADRAAGQLALANEEIAKLNAVRTDLAQERDEATEEKAELRRKLDKMGSLAQEMKKRMHDADAARQTHCAEMQIEIGALTGQLQADQQRIAKLVQSTNHLETQGRALKTELHLRQTEFLPLITEAAHLQAALDETNAQLDGLASFDFDSDERVRTVLLEATRVARELEFARQECKNVEGDKYRDVEANVKLVRETCDELETVKLSLLNGVKTRHLALVHALTQVNTQQSSSLEIAQCLLEVLLPASPFDPACDLGTVLKASRDPIKVALEAIEKKKSKAPVEAEIVRKIAKLVAAGKGRTEIPTLLAHVPSAVRDVKHNLLDKISTISHLEDELRLVEGDVHLCYDPIGASLDPIQEEHEKLLQLYKYA
ncbi:hypothetical protein JCM11491_005986 [Sporobolomyces phaffii]